MNKEERRKGPSEHELYLRSLPKFTNNPNEQFWWHRGLQLSEDDIRRSMDNTNSIKDAALYLGVSLSSWKRYASKYKDGITGKTLYELHKEKSASTKKEIVVVIRKKGRNWNKLLSTGKSPSKDRLKKLKSLLIEKEKLKNKCNRCGYKNCRQEDNKIPLILYFRNGDKTDWRLENLELVCYNCSFVYSLDFFKDSLIDRVESTPLDTIGSKKDIQEFNQLDDFYMDYMKELGMSDEDIPKTFTPKTKPNEDIGNEFIDRL